MSPSMRELILVVLAKGGNPTDLTACPSRSLDACRPLAMANTDCEIMPVAFSSQLEKEARECVHTVQACIRGGSMTDQILEAECWG
eukprot:6083942-Pyramimonas_sp.AAC.1